MKQYSWWTPTGWINAPCKEYDEALASDEIDDWFKALEIGGYRKVTSTEHTFPNSPSHETVIWRHHPSGNALVVTDYLMDGLECEYFVADEHAAAFLAERWPAILGVIAARQQSDALCTIARSIVAFVRHGHGTDTIDDEGRGSYDDYQRAALARRDRKALIRG